MKIGPLPLSFSHTPQPIHTHIEYHVEGLMEGIAMFFPCKTCSHDFTEQIKECPPR
jgi:hypothetical protein